MARVTIVEHRLMNAAMLSQTDRESSVREIKAESQKMTTVKPALKADSINMSLWTECQNILANLS